MACPRPPPKLNLQDPHWDAWRSSFQTFRAETQLDLESEEIQISTLRYSMGMESDKLFQSLNLDSIQSYDQVLARLDWYFKAKKKNVMTLRRAFQNRRQLRHETATQFCEALKKCSSQCEFTDEDERVRDQFVFGVHNESLSSKLEQLYVIDPAGYTLDKVVLVAKAFEKSYGMDFCAQKTQDSKDSRNPKDSSYSKDWRGSKELKDSKDRRVRSLKGSIKIVVPPKESS